MDSPFCFMATPKKETISREEAINGIPGLLKPVDPSLPPEMRDEFIENRLLHSREDFRLTNEFVASLRKGIAMDRERDIASGETPS